MTRLFRKTVTPLSPTAGLGRLFGSEADRKANMGVFPMDGPLNASFEISGAVAPRQRVPFVWQGRRFICGVQWPELTPARLFNWPEMTVVKVSRSSGLILDQQL